MPEVPPIREAMQAFVVATPAEASRAAAGLQEPFGPSGEPLRLEEDEVGSYNPPRVPEILAVLEGADGLAVAFVQRLLDWRIAHSAYMEGKFVGTTPVAHSKEELSKKLELAVVSAGLRERRVADEAFRPAVLESCGGNLKRITRPPWVAFMCLQKVGRHVHLGRKRLSWMLEREAHKGEALALLAASGPGARNFLSALLRLADGTRWESQHLIGALAAATADSPEGVAELWERCRADKPPSYVFGVLELVGPHLAGRKDDLIAWLEPQVRACELGKWPPLHAYGSVGRDLPQVIDTLMTFCPEGGADVPEPSGHWADNQRPEMALYGDALEALSFSSASPDRVLPLLVHGLRRFQEYDPDITYRGDHQRVCSALERLGAAAGPALPEVLRLLEEHRHKSPEDREFPADLVGLLVAMGGAAAPALPRLDELSREDDEEEDREILVLLEPDRSWMMAARSIRAAVEAVRK